MLKERKNAMKLILKKTLQHIRENFAYYGFSASALFVGAAIAAVCAFSLPELSQKELVLFFDDFYINLTETGTDAKIIMLGGFKTNLFLFFALIFMSSSIIGLPLIIMTAMAKGFAFSFALAFMFRAYGVRALLFFVSAVLPHMFITFPLNLLLFAICIKFCKSLPIGKQGLKKEFGGFLLTLASLFLLAMAGVLMQAYIEPLLLECFAKFFIT